MNKKNSSLKVLAVAVCAFAALNVHADPITGAILFKGGVITIDNTDLALAKAVTGFSQSTVLFHTPGSSYASVPTGTLVSWTPFTFSPSLSPNPLNPLWTFTLGATTYSFTATSVTVVNQNSGFLDLMGTGFAHIDGFTDTAGNWLLHTDGGESFFTYNGSSTVGAAAGVPDGGVTVTLLGLAVGGLAFLRKKSF